MAKPSQKARFYLEQSLADLRELERKEIFSADEIARIVKKRSEFELRINSRAVQPQDFVRYLEWEDNLESLRKVRVSRLGVKKQTYYAGQRRMMFVMERATRRFPGDLNLWLRYVQTAKKQNSYKKITQILTSLVRLHSTKPETWVFVASYAMDDLGDVAQARSYMQRGLRFCKNSHHLWLEYFKLELGYIAKLTARRNILGLNNPSKDQAPAEEEVNMDSDFISLPAVTAAEWEKGTEEAAVAKIEQAINLQETPALAGAIPMAIFDAAMDHFNDMQLAERFFIICSSIGDLPCANTLGKHIADRVTSSAPTTLASYSVTLRLPLLGIEPSDSAFPQALSQSLVSLNEIMKVEPSAELASIAISWLVPLTKEDLDPDIQIVVSTILSRLFKVLRERATGSESLVKLYAELLKQLPAKRYKDTIIAEAQSALQIWPSNSALLQLAGSEMSAQ